MGNNILKRAILASCRLAGIDLPNFETYSKYEVHYPCRLKIPQALLLQRTFKEHFNT